MMTIYRKRIIRGRTHMAVYSFCLALSAFHMARCMGLQASLLIAAMFLLRINLPRQYSNKYAIWALFLCISHYPASLALLQCATRLELGIADQSVLLKSIACAALLKIAFVAASPMPETPKTIHKPYEPSQPPSGPTAQPAKTDAYRL